MDKWLLRGSTTTKMLAGIGLAAIIGGSLTAAYFVIRNQNSLENKLAAGVIQLYNKDGSVVTLQDVMSSPSFSPSPSSGSFTPYPTYSPTPGTGGSTPYPTSSPGSFTPYPTSSPTPGTGGSTPYPTYSPTPGTGGSTPYPTYSPTPGTGGSTPYPTYSPTSGESTPFQYQSPPPGGFTPMPYQTPPPGGTPFPYQTPPSGQPGPSGYQQYGQPGGPYPPPPINAASTNIGPPPDLNFQQAAGLVDPDKCFREKGGDELVNAMRSGRMTPSQALTAGSCFSGNFNFASGSGPGGQPGQGGPGGQPGQPGQSGPAGQLSIFSDGFIQTMAQVKPPSYDCVKRVVSEAIAEQMFTQGVQPDSGTRDKIFAAGCFGPPPGGGIGGQPGPNGQPGGPPRQMAAPPLEVVDCLNKIAGYGDIQSGKRVPSPTEFSAGQSCYAKANAIPFFVPPSEVKDDSPLALCAKAVIGVTDISKITPNSLTYDQRQQMRQCYAPAGEQAMANTQPSLPQAVADCVKNILGETVFAQVSTGKIEPTSEQRKSVGAACFQKKAQSDIARLSSAAVPLSQTQALLADVDATRVFEPNVLAPTSEDVDKDPDASQFELSGKLSVEAETVDVYVNSDATIITTPTKKDANGKNSWSTKVAYSSLSKEEKHTLYTLVTTADGTVVRSPVVAFEAKPAAAVPTTASAKGLSWKMMALYGGVGVLVLGLLGFLIARRRAKPIV